MSDVDFLVERRHLKSSRARWRMLAFVLRLDVVALESVLLTVGFVNLDHIEVSAIYFLELDFHSREHSAFARRLGGVTHAVRTLLPV